MPDKPRIILPDTAFREILEEAESKTNPWQEKVKQMAKHIETIEKGHTRIVAYVNALERFIVAYADPNGMTTKDREYYTKLFVKHTEDPSDVPTDS